MLVIRRACTFDSDRKREPNDASVKERYERNLCFVTLRAGSLDALIRVS